MAMGIDDVLSAAAAGISLTDTVVKTVKAYGNNKDDLDIELLIDEVRITALQRLDEADMALTQLERTLREKGIKLSLTLQEVIESTPWWKPGEAHRLKRIRNSFNCLADATYGAVDDIAALVRCRNQTKEGGFAIVESAKAKHDLHRNLLNAKSFEEGINLLRHELVRHKLALQ